MRKFKNHSLGVGEQTRAGIPGEMHGAEAAGFWGNCLFLRQRVLRRYVQFCLVGGSGVVVDMAIIWLLADPSMLKCNLTVSKLVAAEIAIINNFVWNDMWTFRGLGNEGTRWLPRLVRLGTFNLICSAGIVLSILLLNLQVLLLHANVYVANFISIVAVSIWNFWMNLKFGWKSVSRVEADWRSNENRRIPTAARTLEDSHSGDQA